MGGPAWLFCPADRPERFPKAVAAADLVILDLEDGVAPADRSAARAALAASALDPALTVVRINPVATADHALDLDALARTDYRRVMLAKSSSAAEVAELAGFSVTALCETPAGVLAAPSIAMAENVEAMFWGSEDLLAGLGGSSSRRADGRYRDVARQARSLVLLAAGAAGKPALDSVYLDIPDLDGMAAESTDAAASGFAGKVCIHPTQVAVVRAAFRPSAAELDWAQRVLAAAEGERGVFRFEDRMVDEPVLRHARALLARG
jgi:citrate lyase subunit beta/citryl-CoA lyase